MIALQQTAGNSAVQRMLESGRIQASLRIGQPNDIYEQEADHISDQIMRMPEPAVQRDCSPGSECPGEEEGEEEGEERTIQAKSEGSFSGIDSVPDSFTSSLGSGQPLDPATRAFFEPRFGADFGHVRVHTGSGADHLNEAIDARAFTLGRDIVFRKGEYSPEVSRGQKLIAHELAHVIQQSHGQVRRRGRSGPYRTPGNAIRQEGDTSAGETVIDSFWSRGGLPENQPDGYRERENDAGGGTKAGRDKVPGIQRMFPGLSSIYRIIQRAKKIPMVSVMASMDSNKKIGSLYFDGYRIRLIHADGPEKASHDDIRRYNISENRGIRKFSYTNTFFKRRRLGKIRNWRDKVHEFHKWLDEYPEKRFPGKKRIYQPSDLSETPLKNTVLFEILRDRRHNSRKFKVRTHLSRGAAVRIRLSQYTINTVHNAIKDIEGIDDADKRNRRFYDYVKDRNPSFAHRMHHPDDV